MEVDENTLTWPEGLRMLLEILPTAEEATKLLAYDGDLESLDRPETMLRSIADIPRLQVVLPTPLPPLRRPSGWCDPSALP